MTVSIVAAMWWSSHPLHFLLEPWQEHTGVRRHLLIKTLKLWHFDQRLALRVNQVLLAFPPCQVLWLPADRLQRSCYISSDLRQSLYPSHMWLNPRPRCRSTPSALCKKWLMVCVRAHASERARCVCAACVACFRNAHVFFLCVHACTFVCECTSLTLSRSIMVLWPRGPHLIPHRSHAALSGQQSIWEERDRSKREKEEWQSDIHTKSEKQKGVHRAANLTP